MPIIKCKMCGGDLNLTEGSTVCECEYCGTKQTVPSADNEKKLTLFGRAGRLLRACEFDKAAGVFETIVADFPQEAEAYWGLVLCKYGIEYVDDPATGKKIPTCHRSSFDSVLDDANFEQACENTDAVARRVYRDEARQIEELRQAILQVSGREEPYDVFISYKETDEHGERTLDSVIAQDIYKELTNEGYRVFFSRISLEDKLGAEYEPYIFAALNSAKVMLVVGTDYENFDAVWVKNEWSRFLKLIAKGEKKTLIP
ncbi:MAG: toll/interleukin-1 receptor domain-containing protein, partial [Oscillospiraceae bacterium]|nr:toll/interleukin-1 receptor domain-containing protein [Oscillospiraceae bacterium]